MRGQTEYYININAKLLSTLKESELERQLVASLHNVETGVNISDGKSEKFEVLDYIFTNANKCGYDIDAHIKQEIKGVFLSTFKSNGYDESLFNIELFDKAVDDGLHFEQYEIGRIDALAEMYFLITGKINPYAGLVRIIASYN